jgi:hypothetical protein
MKINKIDIKKPFAAVHKRHLCPETNGQTSIGLDLLDFCRSRMHSSSFFDGKVL